MTEKYTSLGEEIISSITHGVGLLLAILGSILLISLAPKSYDFWKMLGIVIFSISLILTYTFSTLYHALYFTKAQKVFRRLDHSIIFLLIAATYTPFILTYMRNSFGLLLLLAVWLFTIMGIILKSIFIDKFGKISLLAYILLGWMGIVTIKQALVVIPLAAIFLLILGGLFYTIGTIFYSFKRLLFNHGIWHLFVLFGSICHYLAILFLLP